MHLMIEGWGAEEHLLMDADYISEYMRTITELTEMTMIDGPHVYDVPTGIVGIAVWAESHISFHYVKQTNQALIDLFSCKEFDTDQALYATISWFGFQSTKTQTLERGLEYVESGMAGNQ